MKTYGTATLKDGKWHVKCAPHVALRLKRMFGRLSTQQAHVLVLKATDEVSRDLLWFTQRFPLDVTPMKELKLRADRHAADCDSFDRLIAGDVPPMQFDLALPARDYQRVAATALLNAHGLLLADDLGVGKTVSAICALTDPRMRPALVVTLTHLPKQWEAEIKRFCPRLTTRVIKKGSPYDVRLKAKPRGRKHSPYQVDLIEPAFPDVLIINYHKLAGWAESLAGVVKSVTFDEVQELRIADSNKTRAASLIAASAHYRLGMSATPIYNRGGEFYNVISVLRPDVLGVRQEFHTEWCTGSDEKAMIKDPEAFGTYLRESGIMLRRTRKDVQRELPAMSRTVHHCDADADALREAENRAAELARIILDRDTSWHEKGEATREIDWKMRQATGIAKAPYVAAFVQMLVDSGESVVLYGWHRAVYDLWADLLKDCAPVFFTGEESTPQKEAAKQAFLKGESKVLVMSLRAGAGLDGLQHACRTVVFGELDWSPGVHEQCEGRVHRDGQGEPVAVYYLVSEAGSDPIVSEVVGLKRGQIEGVRDPNADKTLLQVDSADGIKRLAERYAKHGQPRARIVDASAEGATANA